jgi:hypothetical protein
MIEVLGCEICCREVAVGVASTIIPYSAAFGRRCLRASAQPRWIVDTLLEENGGIRGCNRWFLDHVKVFMPDGRYLTVREYDKHLKLHGR